MNGNVEVAVINLGFARGGKETRPWQGEARHRDHFVGQQRCCKTQASGAGIAPMMPEQLRACEPCRQRPGRMGATVIAVDNGDIFGPQEAYLWHYVSKDAQYGACIDTYGRRSFR